jgi:hypothetical protein
VINLWEVEANLVFENKFSSLLPFVPILKGGNQESVVKQAVIKLREVNLIIRQISRRFGDIDPMMVFQIRQLQIPQLEALGESLFDFTNLSDLDDWLRQNT